MVEKLEELDTLEVKLKDSGNNVLSKNTAGELSKMHKTVIFTMHDELDRPSYQYELQTDSLKEQDYNLTASVKNETEDDIEVVSYTTPFTSGKLNVWVAPTTDYVISNGSEESTVTSDANGKLSIPLSSTTVSYHEPAEEPNYLPIIIGAVAGLIVLGAILAAILKKRSNKKTEDNGEEVNVDEEALEKSEEAETPAEEPEKETEETPEADSKEDKKTEEFFDDIEINEDASNDIDKMYEEAEKEEAERRASIEGDN